MIFINNEKLDKIKLNNDNMYVVLDFDKTITVTNCEDSWDAAGKNLGLDFKKKIKKLYEKYRPIELNHKISYEEKYIAMEKWYKECMDLYFEYNLTKELLEASVKESNLKLRNGAKEFLTNMYENKIPVIILSAGIGNTIELFLKEKNCLYENISIISNFIEFDKNGNMKEFKGEIIHSLNKNIKHNFLKEIKERFGNRYNSLLVGDAIEDIKIIPEEQLRNTITVNFLNENVDDNIEQSRKTFDIVLTGNDTSFETIEKIINL